MKWLSEAEKHKLVVGSQARILYSDQVGRVKIALAFNEAVATGKLKVRQFFSLTLFSFRMDTFFYIVNIKVICTLQCTQKNFQPKIGCLDF